MLSPKIAQYLPYAGILFLFLGLIFGIISVVNYTYDKTNPVKSIRNVTRFGELSMIFVFIGGFLLLGPIK
jgi:hypothetical protein